MSSSYRQPQRLVAVALLILTPAVVGSKDKDTSAVFQLVDELKTRSASLDASKPKRDSKFKKYGSHAFSPVDKLRRIKPTAKRKVGQYESCEAGSQPVVELVYHVEGALVRAMARDERFYWTAPFQSEVLLGLRSGLSMKATRKLLGRPLRQTKDAMVWACKDWEQAEYNERTVYIDCLRVFFKDSKVLGAVRISRKTCG